MNSSVHSGKRTRLALPGTRPTSRWDYTPSTIAAIDAPKLGELGVRATGPYSYQRYNGVFKDGVLVRGSNTFHGYEDHLNGV